MIWDGIERRTKKRYGIRNSTVRYRKGSGPLALLAGQSPTYLLLNVSEQGCHFISKEQIPPGTMVSLTIDAPRLPRTIPLAGRVIWTQKSAEVDAFRTGVTFTRVPGKAKPILKTLLDNAILDNVEISTRVYMKEVERL